MRGSLCRPKSKGNRLSFAAKGTVIVLTARQSGAEHLTFRTRTVIVALFVQRNSNDVILSDGCIVRFSALRTTLGAVESSTFHKINVQNQLFFLSVKAVVGYVPGILNT